MNNIANKEDEQEVGEVTAVDGNTLTVRLRRRRSCDKCGLCKLGGDEDMLAEADNSCGAKVGDRVKMEVRSRDVLMLTCIMYGLPFLGMMLGFFAGFMTAPTFGLNSDITGFVTGLLCMGAVFFLLRLLDRRWRGRVRLAEAVEIIKSPEPKRVDLGRKTW